MMKKAIHGAFKSKYMSCSSVSWPGSYCDTRRSCYPSTGKPDADFGIHGLRTNYNDGSYPSNCDPDSGFDQSKEVGNLVVERRDEKPTMMNVFELIATSLGLNLGFLFEKEMGLAKCETRFASKLPAKEILAKIEEIAMPLGFIAEKNNYKTLRARVAAKAEEKKLARTRTYTNADLMKIWLEFIGFIENFISK